MLTTKESAAELNIQPRSVKKLCQRGILKAEKIGRDWLIEEEEVERYQAQRKPAGRPKQPNEALYNTAATAPQEGEPRCTKHSSAVVRRPPTN